MPLVIELPLAPRTAVPDITSAAPEVYQSMFTYEADPKSFHTHQGAKITAPLATESRHLSNRHRALLPTFIPAGYCTLLCPSKEGY